jgi:hypothetical protein
MLDPDRYWPATTGTLAIRLVEVTHQIIELTTQYRDALVSQRQAYYHTFSTSLATSVAAKERDADFASYAEWCAIQDIRCELTSLKHERKLLLRLLDVNDASGNK